jgi:hypothetical protein
MGNAYRDGILGHQFDKIHESFALYNSHPLLMAAFTENHTLGGLETYTKKSAKTRKLESIHKKAFLQIVNTMVEYQAIS